MYIFIPISLSLIFLYLYISIFPYIHIDFSPIIYKYIKEEKKEPTLTGKKQGKPGEFRNSPFWRKKMRKIEGKGRKKTAANTERISRLAAAV